MTTTRRLAAVLAADVAGYSRLMAADEVGTLETLKVCRREVVDPAIAAHNGRIVKTTGDGMLLEFASAVDAVTCAMAVQEAMAARGGAIAFRIGINVGDIIIDGDDIFGDGVNVAARVEGECEPGGVYLSANALEQIRSKTKFDFEDLGEKSLKNIDRPVRIHAARAFRTAALSEPGKPLPLPDKAAIAVLPFQNMSGNSEQDYFADGMVEDIITALSRFKSLFVIARNSSFTYKGKAVDIKQVGRELGVRYVLEGSVRKAGGRVRITGQLIEATTGAHLWADRFDGVLDDVFKLQDQITSSVVGAISPRILQAEVERTKRQHTTSLTAYDFYLRGYEQFRLDTEQGYAKALELFKRSIELDPQFAVAYALAARVHSRQLVDGLAFSVAEAREAEAFARKAIEYGQDDASALSHTALFMSVAMHATEMASDLLNRAIALNPNDFSCWIQLSWISIFHGSPEKALNQLERAVRLSPLDPFMFAVEHARAFAYFQLLRFEDALVWANKVLAQRPAYIQVLRIVFSIAALRDDIESAKAMLKEHPKIVLYPTISEHTARSALRRLEDRLLFKSALRKVGFPE